MGKVKIGFLLKRSLSTHTRTQTQPHSQQASDDIPLPRCPPTLPHPGPPPSLPLPARSVGRLARSPFSRLFTRLVGVYLSTQYDPNLAAPDTPKSGVCHSPHLFSSSHGRGSHDPLYAPRSFRVQCIITSRRRCNHNHRNRRIRHSPAAPGGRDRGSVRIIRRDSSWPERSGRSPSAWYAKPCYASVVTSNAAPSQQW